MGKSPRRVIATPGMTGSCATPTDTQAPTGRIVVLTSPSAIAPGAGAAAWYLHPDNRTVAAPRRCAYPRPDRVAQLGGLLGLRAWWNSTGSHIESVNAALKPCDALLHPRSAQSSRPGEVAERKQAQRLRWSAIVRPSLASMAEASVFCGLQLESAFPSTDPASLAPLRGALQRLGSRDL